MKNINKYILLLATFICFISINSMTVNAETAFNMKTTKRLVHHRAEAKEIKFHQYEYLDEAIRCLGAKKANNMLNRQYRTDQLNQARRDWDKLPSLETVEKTGIGGSLISTLMRAVALLLQEELDIHLHDFTFDPNEEELVVTTWKDGEDKVVLTVPY